MNRKSEHHLKDGLCRMFDPELFFDPKREVEAKLICHTCPVQFACLEDALRQPVFGVWGGTTFEQRKRHSPTDLRRKHERLEAGA